MPDAGADYRACCERAEAVLRDRLTPAQNADVDKTGWFNVRDATGRLWRVWAGIIQAGEPPVAPYWPNLVDNGAKGRTMLDRDPCLAPDLALALLLWFSDKELARRVAREACHAGAHTVPPWNPRLQEFYASFNEDVGGGPRHPFLKLIDPVRSAVRDMRYEW